MADSKVCEVAYEFHGPAYRCAYCGDPSDTIDHTVPRWFIEGNFRAVWKYRIIKVSACRECNIAAGTGMDATFSERKARVLSKVLAKNRNVLSTAEWTDEEIKRRLSGT